MKASALNVEWGKIPQGDSAVCALCREDLPGRRAETGQGGGVTCLLFYRPGRVVGEDARPRPLGATGDAVTDGASMGASLGLFRPVFSKRSCHGIGAGRRHGWSLVIVMPTPRDVAFRVFFIP